MQFLITHQERGKKGGYDGKEGGDGGEVGVEDREGYAKGEWISLTALSKPLKGIFISFS